MFSNRSVDVHRFSMVPDESVPRSQFLIEKTHKTTFDAGFLVPVLCEEVLPGDMFDVRMTAFGRLATPLFPILDNIHLESFFFFVPNRLVWTNWRKFMGEQDNPADSIAYVIPQQVCPAGGYAVNSLQDYFGLPTVGQVGGGNTVSHSALPLRGYNLIYNEWFRDQNLQNSATVDKGDGPDTVANYTLRRRGKRHDYFTSALPWAQKGGTAVALPLGVSAPVKTQATNTVTGAQSGLKFLGTDGSGMANGTASFSSGDLFSSSTVAGSVVEYGYPSNLYADLTAATSATINQLRQAFMIQRVLELDARAGTRYTEIVRAHFGVRSPDARLQRPEYLGGGRSPLVFNPVQQQTQTGLTGGTTPLGTLGATATVLSQGHGFRQAFVEHGYVIGLVNVRADLTYQQGLRKHWRRSTRYDYYLPAFAGLGEQAIENREIYCDGSANDALVFGYQERWAELRYSPSEITGRFRSTYSTPLDNWHAAQRFTAVPTLNTTFIEDTPPLSRLLAAGAAANGQQVLFDSLFSMRVTRPVPAYGVPGLGSRF